jgi:hypothetical protein
MIPEMQNNIYNKLAMFIVKLNRLGFLKSLPLSIVLIIQRKGKKCRDDNNYLAVRPDAVNTTITEAFTLIAALTCE